MMKTLVIIPARGGSKGIPGKNIKKLGGKPLLHYSLETARQVTQDEHICLTTDDVSILHVAEEVGYSAPFIRPAFLAGDQTPMYDVLIHAVNHYEALGTYYDAILLLQPTSPFRSAVDLSVMIDQYQSMEGSLDMLVSVGASKLSPYFNLFEENEGGLLRKMSTTTTYTRQQCPPVYFFNGSVYIINAESLKRQRIDQFSRIRKYCMEGIYNIDVDTELDWLLCEKVLDNGLYKV